MRIDMLPMLCIDMVTFKIIQEKHWKMPKKLLTIILKEVTNESKKEIQ